LITSGGLSNIFRHTGAENRASDRFVRRFFRVAARTNVVTSSVYLDWPMWIEGKRLRRFDELTTEIGRVFRKLTGRGR